VEPGAGIPGAGKSGAGKSGAGKSGAGKSGAGKSGAGISGARPHPLAAGCIRIAARACRTIVWIVWRHGSARLSGLSAARGWRLLALATTRP
jgi:hypothetical protein